jgi:hypothetical protein
MLEKNIRLCTVLYVTKLIQSLRVWKVHHQIWNSGRSHGVQG